MSLSFGGLLPHFVPMLIDAGLDPVSAGRIAGEIGLAVIVSRVVVGLLLDRVFAPRVAIAMCLVGATGGLTMFLSGAARDATGSYSAALIASSVGLVLTCAGFLALPRYPPAGSLS